MLLPSARSKIEKIKRSHFYALTFIWLGSTCCTRANRRLFASVKNNNNKGEGTLY